MGPRTAARLALLGASLAYRGPKAHMRVRMASPMASHTLTVGCLLAAHPEEVDHHYHRAVVLLVDHGADGSRGYTLNRETPFTMGEMASGMGCFADSAVYRGGDSGPDVVHVVHAVEGLDGAVRVGESAMHVGGLRAARVAVGSGDAAPEEFRFVFNELTWGPGVLDDQVSAGVWLVLQPRAVDVRALLGASSMWQMSVQAAKSSAS